MKERFLKFNRGVARVLLWVLTPLLLTVLWIGVVVACLLPRLFAAELLPPERARGGEPLAWTFHPRTRRRGA